MSVEELLTSADRARELTEAEMGRLVARFGLGSGSREEVPDFVDVDFVETRRPARRIWPRLAVAAAVAALLVVVLLSSDAGDREGTVADFLPQRSTTLSWRQGTVPEVASGLDALLSDGTTFYWIGDRTYRSADGQVWSQIEADGWVREWGAAGAGQLAGVFVISSPTGPKLEIVIVAPDGSVSQSTLEPRVESSGPEVIVEIEEEAVTIGPRGVIVTATVIERPGPSSGRSLAWYSPDGETWSPTDLPEGRRPEWLVATDAGFVAIGDTGRLWISPNGTDWSALESLPSLPRGMVPSSGGAVVRADFGLYAVADGRISLLPVPEGDLPAMVTIGPEGIGAGGAGIAYLVEALPDRSSFEIVYSPDGEEFERQPLPESVAAVPENYPMGMWGALDVLVGAEHVLYISEHEGGVQVWIGTPRSTEGGP